MINPLFAPPDESSKPSTPDEGYVLRHRHAGKIEPLSKDLQAVSATNSTSNPAVELIRSKVAALYDEEPNAKEELVTPTPPQPQRSAHQQFMYELSTSGKPLAVIQTEWHNYYAQLSDKEKHTVWQEFYAANARQPSTYTQFAASKPDIPHQPAPQVELPAYPTNAARPVVSEHSTVEQPAPTAKKAKPAKAKKIPSPGVARLKAKIRKRVRTSAATQTKVKQHAQSLLFGLATGSLVLVIFLFSFFNEMIIAPFIQPSRHVSATPIILNNDSIAASDTPEVIIPKISVQIPVVYGEKSIKEDDVQTALEKGVIHYPTTVLPGQQGNAAFFGHSSNNIFNKGKYKFAFVFLRQLVPGDIFHLTYDKKVYSYRVFEKKIVAPSEVSVLQPVEGKPATAALITCDPPGTSTNRLVVWGEQISPDPSGANAPITPTTAIDNTPTELPSEGPKLWSRIWNNIF